MQFLKKASYRDILGRGKESQFHYYEDITAKYKEFELFLTVKDLEELLDNSNNSLKDLNQILKKNGAVIKAIHCPESKMRTCNEGETEISSNYLSLCEVLKDEESNEIFKKVLELADRICNEQSANNNTEDDEEYDINETNINNKKQIIVILHEGCEKGCNGSNVAEEIDCNISVENIIEKIDNLVNDMKIKSFIQIALENVTPFYSIEESETEKGRNCGWKSDNQKSKKNFFETINKELKAKNIQFGSCIDFCHIMVSSKIMDGKKSKSEALEEYFENIDYSEYIYLFHVSNYGEDLSHGKLFSFEKEEDKNAMETIRILCNQHAPKVPITFEMADGTDMEKASLNYEHIMFYFSNKHMFGKFGELLNANEELKDFFDELFVIYSYDKKSVFEITNALWCVKQIILKNTVTQDKEERLFGVDFDKTEVDLSLVRLKAYVYYTRFCNLGNYLAENYYSGDKCIWNSDENIVEDFDLAMKYFIFNDKIHQCVYTGIQYKFLIDFLPKKVSFVRFNDGIVSTREMKIKTENKFSEIVEKIPGHISGTSIRYGEADFYSVGKNFVQCLFKYFDSKHTDWSIRIYENTPINYVDYKGKIYSIQAFTQLALLGKDFVNEKIDISLDISRFASGRDGKATDTLEGFIKYFEKNLSFTKEKVASISDEEVLFTKLPSSGVDNSYSLTAIEGVILKKMCLGIIGKKEKEIPNKLEFQIKDTDRETEELKELKNVVGEINSNKNHKIWKIIEKTKENLCTSKMKQQDLEVLNVYAGNEKEKYEELKEYLVYRRDEEKTNE